MFGIADLITVAVIKNRLAHLASHPDELQYILGLYTANEDIRYLVGADSINQCMDYIMNSRVHVSTEYEMDNKRRPCLIVRYSGDETDLYLGDQGVNQGVCVTPKKIHYLSFDAKSIDGEIMYVSRELKIETKIWLGLYLQNGTTVVQIKGIKPGEDSDTAIYLSKPLPAGTPVLGWEAVSGPRQPTYEINSSTDSIQIDIELNTVGDYNLHRLMSVVARYCIKSGRPYLDKYGIQIPQLRYSMPIQLSAEELEYQSIYSISGKFTDQWVADVIEPIDGYEITLIEKSVNPKNEDIELEI